MRYFFLQGLSGLDLYFAAARGTEFAQALDLSKYMDTNYHILCPELHSGSRPLADWSPLLDRVKRGQAIVGAQKAVPMVVGPLTLVSLAKGDFDRAEMVAALIPAYINLLEELRAVNVPEVQVCRCLNAFVYVFCP